MIDVLITIADYGKFSGLRSKCTTHLLLEGKNMRNTSVNGILESGLSFVRDCDSSLTAVCNWEVREEFGDIACSKDFMNGSKVCSSLLMAKVRSKNTSLHTFPPQKLASTAWRTKPCHIGLLVYDESSSFSFLWFKLKWCTIPLLINTLRAL